MEGERGLVLVGLMVAGVEICERSCASVESEKAERVSRMVDWENEAWEGMLIEARG